MKPKKYFRLGLRSVASGQSNKTADIFTKSLQLALWAELIISPSHHSQRGALSRIMEQMTNFEDLDSNAISDWLREITPKDPFQRVVQELRVGQDNDRE